MAKSNAGIIALVGIAGAGLLLAGKKKSSGSGKGKGSHEVSEGSPDAEYCASMGGKISIRTNEGGGQYGVCEFPDGSSCESFAFMRGECEPGQNFAPASGAGSSPTPVGDPREWQGIGEEDLPEVGGELEGEFETESEDAGFGPDEDAGGVSQGTMHGVEVKPDCVSFMEQIFAPPAEQIDDSIPIRPGVVNETIIPVMGDAMGSVIQGLGSPDTPGFGETAGPLMVLEALRALVPICEWSYDETSGQFLFNGAGDLSSSAKAGGVLNGLFEISSRLIDLKIAAGGEGEPPDGAQSGPSSPSSMSMGQPSPSPADVGP